MINFKANYKRVFAFGCSYTRYMWPTWANIVASQFQPSCEFINFGKSGSGNQFLFTRLAQVHSKFNLQENDLVLVMYPSFTREDRILPEGTWETVGNVFNEHNLNISSISYKFYKSYGCYFHYLLRDLSYIFMIENFLNNLPCDKLTLLSVPIAEMQDSIPTLSSISLIEEVNLNNYKNVLANFYRLQQMFPMSLHEFLYSNYVSLGKSSGLRFKNDFDSHPSPLQALDYLKHIGVPLTSLALEYAELNEKNIYNCNSISQVCRLYTDMQEKCDNAIKYYGIV